MTGRIIIDANPEFSTAHFEIDGYEGEFDEEGVVEIEVSCCCGHWATLCMTAEQFQEIAIEAKKFRDRRVAFLAKKAGK